MTNPGLATGGALRPRHRRGLLRRMALDACGQARCFG